MTSRSPSRSPTRSISPELDPTAISADFVPLRENKLAGDTSLSFDGLLSPPLLLHEDLKDSCGGQLWPAGMVLAKWLLREQRRQEWHGKVVLELGAGGGLVGLALALAREQRTLAAAGHAKERVESPPILITDLPVLLPLMERNIALNRLPSDLVKAMSLPWGGALPDSLPNAHRTPDVILAADCVYFEPAFPLLLETLTDLLDRGKHGAVCYFCMKKRRKADGRFVAALRKKFVVREVEFREELYGDRRGGGEEASGVMLAEVRSKDRGGPS
jgi:predicted nicotinamide N-methyase